MLPIYWRRYLVEQRVPFTIQNLDVSADLIFPFFNNFETTDSWLGLTETIFEDAQNIDQNTFTNNCQWQKLKNDITQSNAESARSTLCPPSLFYRFYFEKTVAHLPQLRTSMASGSSPRQLQPPWPRAQPHSSLIRHTAARWLVHHHYGSMKVVQKTVAMAKPTLCQLTGDSVCDLVQRYTDLRVTI